MARTYLEFSIPQYSDAVDQTIRQVLIAADYKEVQYHLEVVWRKGLGVLESPHYIKVEYPNSNTVRLSGWISMTLAGPVSGKEHDLTGVLGIAAKKSVKKTMEKIQAAVQNQCGSSYHTYQPPQPVPPPTPTPKPPIPPTPPKPPVQEEKRIIFCPNCGCQLRIPVKQNKIQITCPKCKHQFYF